MPIGPSRPLNLAKPESIDIRQAARYFGGDVAHTGPAYLSVHAGADCHGQKHGFTAPFQMPEDVLPLQNTGLREALHVGLEPDGPVFRRAGRG